MLYPLFAMILITLLVGLNALKVRLHSVRSGEMDVSYYSVMQGKVTDEVLKATRAFDNLFQVPMLFYAGGILCIVLGVENAWTLSMAWLFVAARAVQAFVHTTGNQLRPRMLAFLVSFFAVILLWLGLLPAAFS